MSLYNRKSKKVESINAPSKGTPTPTTFEERECSKLVDILQNEFLDLKKVNDNIKENTNLMEKISEKEYLKIRKKL